MNQTARNRKLDIVADAVTAAAEDRLNETARNRALNIVADAVTAGAEGQLNTAANDRSTTITAEARDNASGALDAIANVARFAYVTAIVSNVVERT